MNLPSKKPSVSTDEVTASILDQQSSSSREEVEAVQRMCQVLNERRHNPALASAPTQNPNEESEEEYAIKAEGLRRLKVRQLFKGRQAQTQALSQSQNSTPETKESASDESNATPK